MRSSLYAATGLIGATLGLAASCGFDPTGLPADASPSAAAASGDGSPSASSAAGGSGGAGGIGTSSSGSSSSAGGASSGTRGSGGGGGAGPLIAVAGELLVDLDVNDPTAGTATWNNKGSLGGVFTAKGDPKKGTTGGKSSVLFDGASDAYLGPLSVATLEGNDDRSIELWVLNSKIDPLEETMLSWSNRAPYMAGSMISFNYGNGDWGAVTHWDAPDLAWGPPMAMAAPQENQWHHLAYTYDGTTATVFADGAKKNDKAGTLSTKAGFSINLAVQRDDEGFTKYGSLAIALVRIHSGALTAAEVKANYEAEKMRFQ